MLPIVPDNRSTLSIVGAEMVRPVKFKVTLSDSMPRHGGGVEGSHRFTTRSRAVTLTRARGTAQVSRGCICRRILRR